MGEIPPLMLPRPRVSTSITLWSPIAYIPTVAKSVRDLILLAVPIALIVASGVLSSFVLIVYSFLVFAIVLTLITNGRIAPSARGSANTLTMPGPDRSFEVSRGEILAKGARGTRSILSDARSVLLLATVVLIYIALASV